MYVIFYQHLSGRGYCSGAIPDILWRSHFFDFVPFCRCEAALVIDKKMSYGKITPVYWPFLCSFQWDPAIFGQQSRSGLVELWIIWSEWQCPWLLKGRWATWPLKLPCNPVRSVIIWFYSHLCWRSWSAQLVRWHLLRKNERIYKNGKKKRTVWSI